MEHEGNAYKVYNTSLMSNKIREEIRILSMVSTTIHLGRSITIVWVLHYVNKDIALVRPKDVMVYARGINHE